MVLNCGCIILRILMLRYNEASIIVVIILHIHLKFLCCGRNLKLWCNKFGCHALDDYNHIIMGIGRICILLLLFWYWSLKIVCNISEFIYYNFDSLFVICIPNVNLKVNLTVVTWSTMCLINLGFHSFYWVILWVTYLQLHNTKSCRWW
jgi:hypothetical protein